MQEKTTQGPRWSLPADATLSRPRGAVPTAGLLTCASLSKQTRFPATPHGQPVQISLLPATNGQHCLSARTIYTFSDTKYSEFSKPTCFSLEAPSGYKVVQKDFSHEPQELHNMVVESMNLEPDSPALKSQLFHTPVCLWAASITSLNLGFHSLYRAWVYPHED